MANDDRETRAKDAERRRNLEGNTLFENLGAPIQKLLMQLSRDISNSDLELYSKITVRQLAKVFDMLALEEDPEKILAWLHREALKRQQLDPGAPKQHGRGIRGEGIKDPIKFYRELEKKNMEMMEQFQKAQEEREELRQLNAIERKRRREEAAKAAVEDRARAEKTGEDLGSASRLKKTELADIVGTFERFTARSTYDNLNSNQDNEWWKKDDYRRDFEKNGARGKLWTRVVEGGTHQIPESEQRVREEWYRSQCWWKSDKYRRDWLASRDTEWWKEENYIRDWQDNDAKGTMWTAADELSGYNSKGHRRPAPALELERRVEWYKNNGPKGIVKLWCASSEGQFERCTLEEKRERVDYFKNGDWWKSDVYVQKIRENPATCSALHAAGAAAEDGEWWKDETVRTDFLKGGSLWKSATEKSACQGLDLVATTTEVQRRSEWFNTNWWKAEKYVADFRANGKLWRLADGADENGKYCSSVELRMREEWYRSCDDRQWWKSEEYIRDWQENGTKGKKWTAGWFEAAQENSGDTNRCSDSELKRREAYFESNWWKQEKYVKDYLACGSKGTVWKVASASAVVDGEWWKQPEVQQQYLAAKQADTEPFWKSAACVADYWKQGATGKKWIAGTAAACSVNIGDEVQASQEDLAAREQFYLENWWRQEEFQRDYAVNGKKGKLWKAANADGTGVATADQLRSRQEFFEPKHTKKFNSGYNAMFEADAGATPTGEPASSKELAEREQFYTENWCRTSENVAEYAAKGSRSKVIRASTMEAARVEAEEFVADNATIAAREKYLENGATQEWWRTNNCSELQGTLEHWQSPESIHDYVINGRTGKKWSAANGAALSVGASTSTVSAEELALREEFMKKNFWMGLKQKEDFQKNGIKGKVWTSSTADGLGARVSDDEIRRRAQYFQDSAEAERQAYLKSNWWKAPEVRADFEAYGKNSKLLKAASAEAAVQGLGDKKGYQASADEIEARANYFTSGEQDDTVMSSQFSTYLRNSEAFWQKPDVIEDYIKNGSKGKKWNAANAAAASVNRGDSLPAAKDQQEAREEFMKQNFWKSESGVQDYLANGSKGKMWTKSDAKSDVVAPAEDLAVREAFFLQPCVAAKERDDYTTQNWWKAPEVRADYNVNGANGKLFRSATAAVAALGLGKQPNYQASEEELAEREAFFKSGATDSTVNEGEFSKKIQAVKNLGENFWIAPQYIDDYAKHGAKGKMWTAADAAAASTNMGDHFRARPDEIAKREAFMKQNFWKGDEFRNDFLQNGEKGDLWKAASLTHKDQHATPEEIAERFAYFTQDIRDEVARKKHIDENWWKSPEAIADYTVNGKKSKFVKAATAAVALADVADHAEYQAPPAVVNDRIKFFETIAKEATTAPSYGWSDTELVSKVKPIEDSWWQDSAFAKDFYQGRDPTFWKNPEYIDDYLKNGKNGKMWTASNAAAGSNNAGDKHPASAEELADREKYMKDNFWKAYKQDFNNNGLKGTKWTMSEPNGKGKAVSDSEMKARANFFQPKEDWQQLAKPNETGKNTSCDLVQKLDREKWLDENWWKCDEVREDYEQHKDKSDKVKAASMEAIQAGLHHDPKYQITPEEFKKRLNFFQNLADNEWWKNPNIVADYVKNKDKGAAWQSQSFKDSQNSLGAENPASDKDLKKRKEWYDDNYWKTPENIADFATHGPKGNLWKKDATGENDVPAGELKEREKWLSDHKPVTGNEIDRRKEWLQQQLSDEEKQNRRDWMINKATDAKKIHRDELADVLAQLNDGERPSDEQLESIIEAVEARRAELGEDGVTDGISQEEFVQAVAETNFYIGATDEERQRAEEEALEALHREEMANMEEVAGYLALEAQEELAAAGLEYTEEEEMNDEEAKFLEEMEQEAADGLNEDDHVDATQEAAWQGFLENQGEDTLEEGGDVDPDQLADEEPIAAADAPEDLDAAWQQDEIGEEEGDDTLPTDNDLHEEVKEELEDVVNEEGWGEGEDPDWQQEPEEALDELQHEEKGQPAQWKLPLPEVTNPQFLKAFFTVMKYAPSHSFLGGKQKRVWAVDHFSKSFYSLDKGGKLKKEHVSNKLLQLERNLADSTRLRLMFFDAAHSYELQFFNTEERERFYETASAIRPSIRVYAPDLTNQDASVEACTTTVDGVGPNSVNVTCNDFKGKPANRELSGECRINASKLLTEPLTVWCGTFNLNGRRPPKNPEDLKEWMPKDKYDVYAVAVQEASYRREENEWFEYVKKYLGKEYLTLASMFLWDSLLIVLTRKKHLLKITNVEGSTKATAHKAICGTKGGIGIAIRYLETSICFVSCHLAARIERNAMRNANIEEVVDGLQLAIRDTDFTNQFNHVFFFGDFNYRTEVDPSQAAVLIAQKKFQELLGYDQFLGQRQNEGVLAGWQEPPITFAPTYRLQIGKQGTYMHEKGNAPSYCARVVTRSMANTWVKCTSYRSAPTVTISEHQPVAATFIVRCVRPVLSCFMKVQNPIPEFVFEYINIKDCAQVLRKPMLLINTPFSQIYKPYPSKSKDTASPAWQESELPRVTAVSQCQEYIETCHVIFILREGTEKREERALRGTGLLTLFGRVKNQQGQPQDFDSDILLHGRVVGKLVGRFSWVASTRNPNHKDL